VRVVLICEGATEAAIRIGLREFVHARAKSTQRLGITMSSLKGPTIRTKLQTIVRNHFEESDVIGVVALTDVYPNHKDATVAKDALRRFAGTEAKREAFKVHAAQFEIEAWILPFWDEIARSLRIDAKPPGANPEQVNGQKPPSHHLKELYRRAGRDFDKVIDGPKWLTGDRLTEAAKACPELKSFLNSLLEFADAERLA